MSKAEGVIKAKCLRALKRRGWYARNNPVGLFKLPWGNRKVKVGGKGESDIIAISPVGRLLWVETKIPGGGFKDSQIAFAEEMRRRGVPCVAIDDPEDLTSWLDERREWLEDAPLDTPH